jgi:hypothetical protein
VFEVLSSSRDDHRIMFKGDGGKAEIGFADSDFLSL